MKSEMVARTYIPETSGIGESCQGAFGELGVKVYINFGVYISKGTVRNITLVQLTNYLLAGHIYIICENKFHSF